MAHTHVSVESEIFCQYQYHYQVCHTTVMAHARGPADSVIFCQSAMCCTTVILQLMWCHFVSTSTIIRCAVLLWYSSWCGVILSVPIPFPHRIKIKPSATIAALGLYCYLLMVNVATKIKHDMGKHELGRWDLWPVYWHYSTNYIMFFQSIVWKQAIQLFNLHFGREMWGT